MSKLAGAIHLLVGFAFSFGTALGIYEGHYQFGKDHVISSQSNPTGFWLGILIGAIAGVWSIRDGMRAFRRKPSSSKPLRK